jgi:hypothetical protein
MWLPSHPLQRSKFLFGKRISLFRNTTPFGSSRAICIRVRLINRRAVALKITIDDFPDKQRWSLQGRLVGQWAAELSSIWRERRYDFDKRKCIVDLIDVTFIDRSGEAVLAEIMSQGAEFVASDVYTKHLLEMLRHQLERTLVRNEKEDEVRSTRRNGAHGSSTTCAS